MQALRDARLAAGSRVLVVGAAGGVGSFALQLARQARAHVTAVASTAGQAFLAGLAPDRTIDYRCQDWKALPERFDLVFDASGTSTFPGVRRLLAPGGAYVHTLPNAALFGWSWWLRLTARERCIPVMERPNLDDLQALVRMAGAGKLRSVVTRVGVPDEVPELEARDGRRAQPRQDRGAFRPRGLTRRKCRPGPGRRMNRTSRNAREEAMDAHRLELVGKSVLAKELSAGDVEVVAGLARLHHLEDGQVITQEGEPDSQMHVIVNGALAVSRPGPDGTWENLHVMTAGDLAGELSFLDGTPRYAALRAVGKSEILSLDRADLESLVDSHPWIAYRLMRAIMRYAHGLQRRMSMQSAELMHYLYKNQAKY